MRALTAVLVLNATLLIGIGAGYLWRGREVDRLTRQLATVRPGATDGVEREFTARGVVRAVLPELNVLVITHDDIPGYMAGMTMGFRAATPALYDGLEVGDPVTFVLRGVPPNLTLTGVTKTAE